MNACAREVDKERERERETEKLRQWRPDQSPCWREGGWREREGARERERKKGKEKERGKGQRENEI